MSPKTDQEKAKAVSVKTTTSKKNPTILKAPSESISSTTQTQKT